MNEKELVWFIPLAVASLFGYQSPVTDDRISYFHCSLSPPPKKEWGKVGQQKADLSPITLNYPKLKVWPEIQSNWIDAFTVYKNCLSRGVKAIDSPCSPWREKRHLEF